MKKLLVSLFAACMFFTASAKVTLPNVLGSNMVLQQQSEINLWGKADPEKKITISVSWSKDKTRTHSDSDGNWAVKVATPTASFAPQTITISDGEKLTLENILIGDVWVCVGQSNMEMPVKGYQHQPVENSMTFIRRASSMKDKIRMFTVKKARSYDKDLDDCVGEWREAAPQSVAETSAVAYFFAHELSHEVNYPIGIITAGWGGSRVEAWMPLAALREIATEEQIKHKHTLHPLTPSELYCGMIAPIRNYKAKGFLWYQGEANLGYQSLEYLGDIDHYDIMLARMAKQWREDWGDKENKMPFYYVMIPSYFYCNSYTDTTLPLFVECQERAMEIIPNSGMASTTDLGEATCLHPSKKFEIGARLAALAMEQTYGCKGFEAKAPQYESHEIKEDGKVKIKMKNAPQGLAPWSNVPVKGFELAGEDRKFHPAEARVWGSIVTVWSKQVSKPVAVRYAFHNVCGEVNLKNLYGVPAIPFRTDRWNDVK